MSEVTKLYENAGIEPEYKDCCIITDKYLNYETELSYEDLMDKECPHNQECTDECEYAYNKIIYPPFTAEKQLKLIEFMLKKYGEETIGFELWKDNSYHAMCQLGYDGFENYADSNTLCGAIAGLITLYWQDLTEEEKQQVKGILE